jgi:hypothetical protein
MIATMACVAGSYGLVSKSTLCRNRVAPHDAPSPMATHACRTIALGFHFHMPPHLFVHFAVELCSANQRDKPGKERVENRHGIRRLALPRRHGGTIAALTLQSTNQSHRVFEDLGMALTAQRPPAWIDCWRADRPTSPRLRCGRSLAHGLAEALRAQAARVRRICCPRT